jgi:hypothetical protein
MRNCLSFVFYVIAILAAVVYMLVETVEETRTGVAAHVTKPLPAVCMAIVCLVSSSSFRFRLLQRHRHRSTRTKRAVCQFDVWCGLFGVAFGMYALADALVVSVDTVMKLTLAGGACFAVGHLLMIAALCLPREVGEDRPSMSPRLATIYGVVGVVAWVVVVIVAIVVATVKAGVAIALATYMLPSLGVAWRSLDVYLFESEIGSVRLAVGAHMVFLADACTILWLLRGQFNMYNLITIGVYYVAIMLEASGIAEYALEVDVFRTLREEDGDP